MKKEVKKKKRILFCLICLCIILIIILYLIINLFMSKSIKINNTLPISMNIEEKDITSIDNSKVFIGSDPANYIVFKGLYYRILRINRDGSLELISANSLTNIKNTKENVKSYLNDKYLSLIGYDYLLKTSTCLDIIDNLPNKECSNIDTTKYVRLPSIEDIIASLDNNQSYLLNEDNYWLDNPHKKESYIVYNHKISLVNSTNTLGVKPVIRLNNNDINITSGTGTKTDPYIIKDNDDFHLGDYIKISNDIYLIYDITNKELGLSLNNSLPSIRSFGQNTKYDPNDKNNIAYYLNNTYLNSLSYKDKINNHKWLAGTYESNYKDISSYTVKAKIGMLNISDIKFNENIYYLINSNNDEIYLSDGTTSKSNLARKIIPTIYINKSTIKSGDGSISSPYILEGLE